MTAKRDDMNEKLLKTCELVASNTQIYKNLMKWETAANACAIMAGIMSAEKGILADEKKYRECKKLLKKKISAWSTMRGTAKTMLITKMTFQEDPEAYIDGVQAVYKKLREKHKFTASPYMVMAAMTIFENGGIEHADFYIEKLENLYRRLHEQHPFLISDEDRGYLSMLVVLGLDSDTVDQNIEECYQACKKVAMDKNAVHSLAQVLSVSNKSVAEKTSEVEAILKEFKENNTRINKSNGLSSIGALTLFDDTAKNKADMVKEVTEYLKEQKCFKWYSVDARTRTTYACLIVFLTQVSENGKLAATISETMTMVLIEEIIMLTVICATTASTSAAANSSN